MNLFNLFGAYSMKATVAAKDIWIPYCLSCFAVEERNAYVVDVGHLLASPVFYGLMRNTLLKVSRVVVGHVVYLLVQLSPSDSGSYLLQITVYLLSLSASYAVLQRRAKPFEQFDWQKAISGRLFSVVGSFDDQLHLPYSEQRL